MTEILILDAYNLFHRARSGFKAGDYPIIFNFFRGLRPLIEKFKPEHAYLVLEGSPRRRLAECVEYKGNRPKMPSEEHEAFRRQITKISELVEKYFPISVVHHPYFEADDIINHLALSHGPKKTVVVSSDTDFIQMLDVESIQLYNPMKKSFIERVDYDYVSWKALRGDAADNIPGIKGIGDKTAEKLVKDSLLFEKKIGNDPVKLAQYHRNVELIQFHEITDDDLRLLSFSNKDSDWESVKAEFENMEFSSMTNNKAWKKYTSTFSCLEDS